MDKTLNPNLKYRFFPHLDGHLYLIVEGLNGYDKQLHVTDKIGVLDGQGARLTILSRRSRMENESRDEYLKNGVAHVQIFDHLGEYEDLGTLGNTTAGGFIFVASRPPFRFSSNAKLFKRVEKTSPSELKKAGARIRTGHYIPNASKSNPQSSSHL